MRQVLPCFRRSSDGHGAQSVGGFRTERTCDDPDGNDNGIAVGIETVQEDTLLQATLCSGATGTTRTDYELVTLDPSTSSLSDTIKDDKLQTGDDSTKKILQEHSF